MSLRVNLKPVFVSYERAFFRELPSEEEVRRRAEEILSELSSKLSGDARLLEPYFLTGPEGLEGLRGELSGDVDAVIVYRVGGMAHRLIAAVGMLGPPLIMVGPGVLNHDIVAYLRHRGREAYAPVGYDELNRLVRHLKVRKALRLSRVLVVTSSGLPSPSVISSAYDLEALKAKFGLDSVVVPTEELLRRFESVPPDREDVRKLVDELTSGAHRVEVSGDNLERCVRLYVALKELMREHSASAVTVSCAEPAFYEHRVTPCLAFSLLNDEGTPAACEADLSALLAIMLLSLLAERPAMMGNLWLHDARENVIRISHDVPPTRPRGFGEPRERYELHDFHERGYGATLYVHSWVGEAVTFARVHADLSRVLVGVGEVLASHEGISCRQTLDIRVEDARRLIKRVSEYGHHFALVLGDYAEELAELGDVLGLEVEVASESPRG